MRVAYVNLIELLWIHCSTDLNVQTIKGISLYVGKNLLKNFNYIYVYCYKSKKSWTFRIFTQLDRSTSPAHGQKRIGPSFLFEKSSIGSGLIEASTSGPWSFLITGVVCVQSYHMTGLNTSDSLCGHQSP